MKEIIKMPSWDHKEIEDTVIDGNSVDEEKVKISNLYVTDPT